MVNAATLVTILMLVNQSFGEVCRTCTGTCSGEVAQISCSQSVPALPFGFKSTSENEIDVQQYGCLNLEYNSDGMVQKIEQCININDYEQFCNDAMKSVDITKCQVSVSNKRMSPLLNAKSKIILDTGNGNEAEGSTASSNPTSESSSNPSSEPSSSNPSSESSSNPTGDTSSTTDASSTASSDPSSNPTSNPTTTTGSPGAASTSFLYTALLIGTVAILAA